jgi:beta-lactamase class A
MQAIPDWSGVTGAVAAAEKDGCVVGFTAIAPGGARFDHNGERRFVAASTVKIVIMVQLYRDAEAGIRSLADPYRLGDADRAPGSGVMLHLHAGMEFTLGDLAYLMISISDNTATNVLIDVLGMGRIGTTMADLGMSRSTIGRKMMGRAAQGGERENWATPADYATAIAALLADRAASPGSCAAMRELLEKQQNERRIARWLPKEARPRWGSKTGSVAGVVNDVGFVVTPAGPLILSAFCENPPDPHAGEAIIGDLSRAALRAVSA